MAKALVIAKMKTGALTRGQIDVPQGVNFVHDGSVILPGNYKLFVITGTGAQLTSVSQHANFLVGQQILIKADGSYDWENAHTAIAPGAITTINTWLVANGHTPLQAGDNIVTLVRKFQPDYEPGTCDVFDGG
jgi:hypothetical protein